MQACSRSFLVKNKKGMLPAALVLFALLSHSFSQPAATSDKKLSEVIRQPVNERRLVFQGEEGRAYLTTAGKVAPGPFTGVAFVEEEWGRAELTYSNGILHGPVVVVVRNRVFSQFEYVNGKKVVPASP